MKSRRGKGAFAQAVLCSPVLRRGEPAPSNQARYCGAEATSRRRRGRGGSLLWAEKTLSRRGHRAAAGQGGAPLWGCGGAPGRLGDLQAGAPSCAALEPDIGAHTAAEDRLCPAEEREPAGECKRGSPSLLSWRRPVLQMLHPQQ